MGEDDCLGFEACVCEIGGFGACFADFELGFFEIFFFIMLLFCAGSHVGSRGVGFMFGFMCYTSIHRQNCESVEKAASQHTGRTLMCRTDSRLQVLPSPLCERFLQAKEPHGWLDMVKR